MDQKDIRQRETEGQETEVLLKRLRVSAVFHALLVIAGGICDAVCRIYALHDRNRSVCTVCAGKDERRSVKASDGVTG